MPTATPAARSVYWLLATGYWLLTTVYSRKDSADARGLGDAIDGEDVCACAHVRPVTFGGRVDAGEGAAHRLFQSVADAVFRPEVAVLILHPLVIADGDAAGVGENVGHEEDAAVEEHAVGVGRHRPVRQLRDDRGAYVPDVRERDAVLQSRRQQHVAINFQNLVARDGLRVRQALDPAGLRLVPQRRLHADAVLVVDARARVRAGDD